VASSTSAPTDGIDQFAMLANQVRVQVNFEYHTVSAVSGVSVVYLQAYALAEIAAVAPVPSPIALAHFGRLGFRFLH
jgi:hypothetical protein